MSKVAHQRRKGRLTRHRRVRKKIHGTAARPRLAVYRTNKHLSVQVIDDDAAAPWRLPAPPRPHYAARAVVPQSTPPPGSAR